MRKKKTDGDQLTIGFSAAEIGTTSFLTKTANRKITLKIFKNEKLLQNFHIFALTHAIYMTLLKTRPIPLDSLHIHEGGQGEKKRRDIYVSNTRYSIRGR